MTKEQFLERLKTLCAECDVCASDMLDEGRDGSLDQWYEFAHKSGNSSLPNWTLSMKKVAEAIGEL